MSSGVNANISASLAPYAARRPWPMRTAFGAPVVPDVKINMNVSAGATTSEGSSAPAKGSSAALQDGSSITWTGGVVSSTSAESKSSSWDDSVSTNAQSV